MLSGYLSSVSGLSIMTCKCYTYTKNLYDKESLPWKYFCLPLFPLFLLLVNQRRPQRFYFLSPSWHWQFCWCFVSQSDSPHCFPHSAQRLPNSDERGTTRLKISLKRNAISGWIIIIRVFKALEVWLPSHFPRGLIIRKQDLIPIPPEQQSATEWWSGRAERGEALSRGLIVVGSEMSLSGENSSIFIYTNVDIMIAAQ